MPLLKLLYNFMGFPYNLKNINSTLGDLLHGGEKKDRYYSLNRDINFDPNHWKGEWDKNVRLASKLPGSIPIKKILLQRLLSDVDRSCGEVIQELGYPLLT